MTKLKKYLVYGLLCVPVVYITLDSGVALFSSKDPNYIKWAE